MCRRRSVRYFKIINCMPYELRHESSPTPVRVGYFAAQQGPVYVITVTIATVQIDRSD